MTKQHSVSRRDVLKTAATASAVTILPSGWLYGQGAPSNQFRFAQVGCGGKGGHDMRGTAGAGGKLVAMVDVDKKRAEKAMKSNAGVAFYTDYRKMLDEQAKNIDAVVVSTPDHMHGAIALAAIKAGKHVYVQKPLARTYQECQVLLDASKKYKVVTQMGNQGHSGDGLKVWQHMVDEKAFGDVAHVDTWSNRPIWAQGQTKLPPGETVPGHLDWDNWLGVASDRPYSGKYLPFAWRGWWDFGAGAMGDMACHTMDPAFWCFKLGLPTTIKAEASAPATVAYPTWSTIQFTFDKSPVTGKPITMTWYDGKRDGQANLPTLPEGCHPGLKPGGNGCTFIGSKLSAKGGSHAARPTVISVTGKEHGTETKDAEKFWRDKSSEFKGDNHYGKWVNACKEGKSDAPGSHFDYSVPFTQSIILGCLALRFPGDELKWDDEKKQFSNHAEANKWLAMTPRAGHSLTLD
jgi:predicted dehydrogenase